MLRFAAALVCSWAFSAAPALAQFDAFGPLADGKGVRLGDEQVQRYKVGMTVRAVGGPCQGLLATIPVPREWPEQTVRIVEEEFSEQVREVRYRDLDDSVRQMVISIPRLATGETATAIVIFEVRKRKILPPADPNVFRLPKNPPMDVRRWLAPSPYIESRHPRIVELSKEIQRESEGRSAWEQVEAFYDRSRELVAYKHGDLKGALAALRDGDGDCEELSSLFIALCRAAGIPARTVWVPGHAYAEFYLEDDEGKGHWIPCQPAGERQFGSMDDTRSILQKGDNFRVPEQREPQRYVAEFLKGKAVRGGGNPTVHFIRQPLSPAD